MEIKKIPGIDIATNEYDLSKVVIVGESGKEYRPTIKLAAGRMAKWEATWLKAKYGQTPTEIFKQIMVMIEHCRKNDLYEVSVQLYKQVEGIGRIADMRPNPLLELSALFCNTADEDIADITDEEIKAKIVDWRYYDAEALFLLAGLLTPALLKDYVDSMVDISAVVEALKKQQLQMMKDEHESKKEKLPSTKTRQSK